MLRKRFVRRRFVEETFCKETFCMCVDLSAWWSVGVEALFGCVRLVVYLVASDWFNRFNMLWQYQNCLLSVRAGCQYFSVVTEWFG